MKPVILLLLAAAAGAQPLEPVDPALAVIATTKRFLQTAVSPNGKYVAYVEALAACDEHAVAFSPDSKQIAFLSDCEKKEQFQLYVAPAEGGPARQLTHLKGLLAEPRWSPDGKHLALLFTENLPHAAGPLD